jgi:hypothetical protein
MKGGQQNMADDKTQGCVATARGPMLPRTGAAPTEPQATGTAKESTMQTMVGREAPDFEASAYHEGGFRNIKLSDFRGKWVFLCFYPGDFTFV